MIFIGQNKMKVEVKLYANLAKLLPSVNQKKQSIITIRKGATINDLLEKMKIPKEISNVIMLNGKQCDRQTKLSEGDKISIFPPIAGG